MDWKEKRPITHWLSATSILACPWRVGHRTGRAIYCQLSDYDDVVGMMDTRELAAHVVAVHNASLEAKE